MADPTPEPTPEPTAAPTPAPTVAPTPSLAEQQLAATLAMVAANTRLADVQQAAAAVQQSVADALADPAWQLAQVSMNLMPRALDKMDGEPTGSAALAVTWALALVKEVRTRNLDGVFD